MQTFVGLSHKGGTGRSVTIANVAHRCAMKGKNVCIIDLDLASPTMGLILGLQGYEIGFNVYSHKRDGFPGHVGDLLLDDGMAARARHAIVDAWSGVGLTHESGYGRFSLIPGYKSLSDDSITQTNIEERLPTILDALHEYDIVFLDARSGISVITKAIAAIENKELSRGRTLISAWLIHFRWTEQHLYTVNDLLGNAKEGLIPEVTANRLRLIRTAFINHLDIKGPEHAWFSKRHDELDKRLHSFCPPEVKLIGTVPLDPMLQWRECIITPELLKLGIAKESTYKAFSEIADFLIGKR
jgi:hypothetical protein